MPESPTFLTTKGNIAKARDSLQWFRGSGCDIEDEMHQIRDGIKRTESEHAHFSDLFQCRATWKALIISLGLMVFQQLSGINAVLFYAHKIFIEAGSSMSPSICAIILAVVQVILNIFFVII